MADVPTVHDRARAWDATIDLAVDYEVALIEPDPTVRAELAAELGGRDATLCADPPALADRLVAGR
jgi:hypothetical protein